MKFTFPAGKHINLFPADCMKDYKSWLMRLTSLLIALLCAGLQLLMAEPINGQGVGDTKVRLELRNEPLKVAFEKIEAQTDFRFAYNKSQVQSQQNISLEKGEYLLKDALTQILAGTSLSFRQVNNKIVIIGSDNNESERMSKEMKKILASQFDGSLHGKITNDKGEPVIGASIVITSIGKGTAADASGQYTLNGITPGTYKLEISALGFESLNQQVIITEGASQTLDIQLKSSDKALNEVVVTGYTRQSKRDVTGAVSTISADIVAKTPVTDVGSVLQGRAAGVSVDAQGGPGNNSIVRIRGFGTNGNNDPLYVIDGVQTRGGNNLVNPNDIETITILKDPSLTSLYGAQGGNGVIVITTKSGKSGTPKLDYSTYGSWESPIKYPKTISPQQYADAYFGYLKNSGLPVTDQYYGSGATPVLPDYLITTNNSVTAVAGGDPAADPSLYDLSSYRIMKTNKEGTDWFREVMGTAFSQSHQLGLSGGTDKSSYAMTMNYLDNKGIVLGTYFKRYSLRVNTEFKPAKWLKIGENMQLSYSQGASLGNHNPQGLIADLYKRSGLLPVYDIAGNYSGPKGIANSVALFTGDNNPIQRQTSARANSDGYSAGAIGSAYIAIEPIKGLIVESKIGIQFYPSSYRVFNDTFPQNIFSAPYNSFTEGSAWSSDWRWTNKISYDFRINTIHKFNAFAAFESREYKFRASGATTPNLPYTTPGYLNLNNGNPNLATGPYNTVTGDIDYASSVSVFGNINYSLLDKYIASFVLRRDGSSKFGPLNKYGTFPSYSVGWRISKERFMDGISWLNDLKLRAAIGENGNDAIPTGLYENQYTSSSSVYPLTNRYDINGENTSAQTGLALYRAGNASIHWESNKTTNLGFDAALFNNKLTVGFSWFNRVTKDLLAAPPITGLAGDALPPFQNILEFSNKGIELELGFSNTIAKDFRYELNFNIATYRNKVAYINGDSSDFISGNKYAPSDFVLTRSVVGRPVSSFYGFVQEGIFQSEDDYNKYGVTHRGLTPATAAGHFKFVDLNKDGQINDDDQTFLGTPHPKFSYGFNVNLFYKDFDLSIFLQGVQGNKLFNYWRSNSVFPGKIGEGSLDTWSVSNTGASLPIWNNNPSDDSKPSSFFVEDGSYLRVKSLQIGYTLPKTRAFSKLRVYVQGYNLFTFTNYKGIDPEVSTGDATNAGIDFGGVYPIARKLIVGLNFGL